MAQELTLLPAGWIPDPNPHSAAPPGAASVANNVVIARRGVVEPRPGFPISVSWTAASIGSYILPFNALEYMWETVVLTPYVCSYLVRLTDGARVTKNTAVGAGVYPSVNVGAAAYAEMRTNLYFTTSDGLRRLETEAGAAGLESHLTGVPAGLTPLTNVKVALGHWFKADSQVAYRIVFQKTVKGIPLYGAPSGHQVVTNPAAGSDGLVELDIPLPLSTTGARGGLGVVAGDRLLVYRTTQTHLAAGGGESIDPGDEMQTVMDIELTAAHITAGRVAVADYVEDINLGPFLYTNSTADGILQENSRPPVSSEVVEYAGSLYFGNCQPNARQAIDIVDPEPMETLILTSAELTAGSTTVVNFAPWVVKEEHVGRFLGAVQDAGGGPWDGEPLNGGTYLDRCTQIIAADTGTNTYTISKAALVSTTAGANSLIEAHSYVAAACQGQIDDAVSPPYFHDIYFSNSPQNPQSITKQIFTVDTVSALKTAESLAGIASQNGNRYFNTFPVGTTTQATVVFEERTPTYAAPSGNSNECEMFGYAETEEASGLVPSPTRVIPEPFALGSGLTFESNQFQNRVYFSKQAQPEAVPALNFFDVGSSSFPVQRMIRTRESLFIFKRDGIYRLTSTNPLDQRLDLVDPTFSLVHPDAACAFDNKVFAWTNQGVVMASDAGILPISANVVQQQLEDIQTTLAGASPDAKPFCFADESRDIVYLGIPSVAGSLAYCTEIFVFCARTSTWSRYDFSDRYLRSGIKRFTSSGAKFVGSTTGMVSSAYEQTALPYDQTFTIALNVVSGTEVTITGGSGWTPVVGDVVQAAGIAKIVTAVASATTFTVQSTGLAPGAGTAYVAVSSELEFIVKEAQNPGRLKHWLYVTPVFGALKEIVTFDATFKTNQDITPATLNASVPYSASVHPRVVRLTPTRQHSRAAELFVKFGFRSAFADWELQGMSLTYHSGSTRVQR